MTHLISKMQQIEQAPHLLLEGRIAFRKRWALLGAPKRPPVSDKAIAWEIAYDEEHNFARMGAEFVDEDWGKPKSVKPRAKKQSDFLKASFVLATAKALEAVE